MTAVLETGNADLLPALGDAALAVPPYKTSPPATIALRAYPQIMLPLIGTFRNAMIAAARWLSARKLRLSFS